MWGGVSPSPQGEGSGERAVPPPHNFFLILALRMVGFGAFWVVFFKVELFVLHAKISVLRLPKLAIARCICRSPEFFFIFGLPHRVLLQFKAQVYDTCLGIFEA